MSRTNQARAISSCPFHLYVRPILLNEVSGRKFHAMAAEARLQTAAMLASHHFGTTVEPLVKAHRGPHHVGGSLCSSLTGNLSMCPSVLYYVTKMRS